jgi:hypothetical protein
MAQEPPPPAETPKKRAHRGNLLLCLALLGFLASPFALACMILSGRDLRAIKAGTMDDTGVPNIRLARKIAIVAGIYWAIKTVILLVGVSALAWYFDWL